MIGRNFHTVLIVSSFLLLASSAPLFGQNSNTDITRDQAIQYAHSSEQNPLGPVAAQHRAAAMKFFEDDHTSHVLLCQPIFRELVGNKKNNAHEITLQMLISAAAFLSENPDAAESSTRQNLAGMDSALNVYEKFIAVDPGTKSHFLDSLLKKRQAGKLEGAIHQACK